MTEQEEARERARLMLVWADGKTLQLVSGQPKEWIDYTGKEAPVIRSSSCWRVKPEPRRKWERVVTGGSSTSRTENPEIAADWKARGYTVTEWMEVLS